MYKTDLTNDATTSSTINDFNEFSIAVMQSEVDTNLVNVTDYSAEMPEGVSDFIAVLDIKANEVTVYVI